MPGIWDDEAHMVELANEGLEVLGFGSFPILLHGLDFGCPCCRFLAGEGDGKKAGVDTPPQECYDFFQTTFGYHLLDLLWVRLLDLF